MQLLNVAWDAAATLVCDFDMLDYREVEKDPKNSAYWKAAKIQLSTGLTIAQQGSEFLLKARIAKAGVHFLLGVGKNKCTQEYTRKSRAFSEFRTVDAQDLIKIYRAVCDESLDNEFAQAYERLRRQRNSLIHSAGSRLSILASDLMCIVLSINQHLGREENWVKVRRDYLHSTPVALMNPETYADYRLVGEFGAVRDLLTSAQIKTYFAFDKRRRNYLCPCCVFGGVYGYDEREPRTAMLEPNKHDSETVWCFVCDETQNVERIACASLECKGNVLSYEWGRCLTCGTEASCASVPRPRS